MEHIDPGSRMGHSTVMLSPFVALRVNSAKHLSAQSSRPFAAAQGDSVRWLRFMCIGGLLWSPVGGACCPFILLTARNRARSHPRRVTVKVTPTGRPASGLCSWLRLMRIRADQSAVCAINRHLRMDGIFCSCAYCFISNGR
jgi:hypothetical protein